MKTILFTHPDFLNSTSMPLFARFLSDGIRSMGHEVEVWTPSPVFHRIPCPQRFKKWLGYIDQFVLFPVQIRSRLRRVPRDTLFIFSDHALGPWVPLVADRPHAIHCHDFLALRSALGEVPQNKVSWTGRRYQDWIRKGFSKGRNFISISGRTRNELHRFLGNARPDRSVVVFNALNHPYLPLPAGTARDRLVDSGVEFPNGGFVLHVGGNQWYKNRSGVLAVYSEYARRVEEPIPLVIVGAAPTESQRRFAADIPKGKVFFVVRPPIELLEAAYSAASVLLFPSHAEGFGWPIIEAMACGCPVLTTDDSPMTEVGGPVAGYIPKMVGDDVAAWACTCVEKLTALLSLPAQERAVLRDAGIAHARNFDPVKTVERYLTVYHDILENEGR